MAVTRTAVTPNPGHVVVSPSIGEHLHFQLSCVIPFPIFSFSSDANGVLHQAADFIGHPLPRYEWEHLKNPSDIRQLEALGLRLSFLTAPQPAPSPHYQYKLEKRNAAGTVLAVVFDIQFTAAPTDLTDEFVTVVIQ